MDIDELTAEEYRTPKVQHDVHEPTTYELAEAELKAQERSHKYLWDEMYAI
jgi:hypothetical protein